MHQPTTRELRLQVAPRGDVWATTWLEPHPRRVAENVEQFVESKLFSDSTSVAVVAFQNNVSLITEIYLHRHKDPNYTIWVSSPALVGTAKPDRIDPVSVLEASRGLDPHLSPSLGGWHKFGKKDYPSYALSEMVSRDNVISKHAIQLLKAHPVWPALSFISGLNLKMCCRLFAIILDPRWFIDLNQPARTSRLESYLGLTLKVQRSALNLLRNARPAEKGGQQRLDKALSRVSDYETKRIERCTVSQYCWWQDPAILTVIDTSKTSKALLLDEPGGFLWRIWFSHGTASKGYLRTSQQFIRFLRDAWLDALYSKTVGDRLFTPDHFFKHEYEKRAFLKHIEKFKRD